MAEAVEQTGLRQGLPDEVRRVIEAAEFAAERAAARLRLVVMIAVGALLGVLGVLSEAYRPEIAAMFALYAAVSVLWVVLTRPATFRPWVPWAATTLDAGVVLGIMVFAQLNNRFSGSYATSLVISWTVFVLLALAAMRLKPTLVLYLGGLLVAGMAIVTQLGPASAATPQGSLGLALGRVFDAEHNAVRLALVALAAGVLALSVARHRRTLIESVIAARRSAKLSRYFASGLVPLLADTDLALLQRGRRQLAAILFADIRGFTARSEQLEPAAIAEFLAAFRARATRAIEHHGGIVDKFVGDDVMGVFGVPVATPADAANALAAGRALLAEIEAWNGKRRAADRRTVAIGIGIHYGEVFAGVVGEGEPLEFTVIGDAVNTARRIEELTKTTGWPMLVSAELIAAAASGNDVFHNLPAVALRGRREPVELYATGRLHLPLDGQAAAAGDAL